MASLQESKGFNVPPVVEAFVVALTSALGALFIAGISPWVAIPGGAINFGLWLALRTAPRAQAKWFALGLFILATITSVALVVYLFGG